MQGKIVSRPCCVLHVLTDAVTPELHVVVGACVRQQESEGCILVALSRRPCGMTLAVSKGSTSKSAAAAYSL